MMRYCAATLVAVLLASACSGESKDAAPVPAFQRLSNFIGDEYQAAARDTVGLYALPGGDDRYAFLVRYYLEDVDSYGRVTRHGPVELIRPTVRKRVRCLQASVQHPVDPRVQILTDRTSSSSSLNPKS